MITQIKWKGWGGGISWLQFRHPTYERKHFQQLSKVKTHKEESHVVRSRTVRALLLHWSIVPTFKRRQMRKIHTSNDKTNSCHVTEAATHTGSTALTALSVCFAGFEVILAGRTVMEVREGGLGCHTLQVKIKFVLMRNRETGLSLAVK